MPTIECSGFLFIGDPHLSSITPGRRKDVSFADTVLDKLGQARDIANSKGLQAVILGDLFDRARDSQLRMLSRLVKVLQGFDHVPLCLVGNHDRAETTLSEGTALELVHASGALALLTGDDTPEFKMAGTKVLLHGIPHGKPIAPSLPAADPAAVNVLVTHHDLAFDRPYPGAIDPPPVEHVVLAVNGHMHLSRPPVVKGNTTWHNPGNITRLSLDCKDQIPRVWEWNPGMGSALRPIDLVYQADVLHTIGRQVDALEMPGDQWESEFATLLKEPSRLEAARTDDGTFLLEDLAEVYSVREVSAEAKAVIKALCDKQLGVRETAADLPAELDYIGQPGLATS